MGIYIPNNERLRWVLDGLPKPLANYREHAMMLLHFIATKSWINAIDDDGFTRLHSAVLRKYIPNRALPRLVRHLVNARVIETVGHSAGAKSRGYRIAAQFNGTAVRIPLTHPGLRRKLLGWRDSFAADSTAKQIPEIVEARQPILAHMLDDLDRLELAMPSDDLVARIATDFDVDLAHLRYACQAIEHGDHDGVKVDPFGLRIHSVVTRISKRIRPYLRLDGDRLVEIDVANAQPLILAVAFHQHDLAAECTTYEGRCTTYVGNAQHNGRGSRRGGPGVGGVAGVLRAVPTDVVRSFTLSCANGGFYEDLEELSGILDRSRVKRELCRDVLFGKPHVRGLVTEAFERRWPEILERLQDLKRRYGYKIISQMCQRLESRIMIDGVCGRLVRHSPGVRFLTIHDSLLVAPQHARGVVRAIEEEFAAHGVGVSLTMTTPGKRKFFKKFLKR